ncbi:MAG: DUF1553 domain-containing protein, partial [Verrucomicrobiota bacterium]
DGMGDGPAGLTERGFGRLDLDRLAIDDNPDSAWGLFPNVWKPQAARFILTNPLKIDHSRKLEVRLHQLHGRNHLIGRFRLSATGTKDTPLGEPLPEKLIRIFRLPAQERTHEQRKKLNLAYLRQENEAAIARLPEDGQFYGVASHFKAQGNFKPAEGPRPVFFLNRGDARQPGDPAIPGALGFLDLRSRFILADDHTEGDRRAALARWMSHEDNPLLWRSIVNRLWHHHFGRGLVDTLNDFGRMGSDPSHPKLLDWLAFRFRAEGGSMKSFHRLVLTSAVYRQNATGNPEAIRTDAGNRLLWRANPRRLEAESIRDAVLQFSGLLDLTMHGPSARQFHTSKGVHVTPNLDYQGFDPDNPVNFRRAVYRFVFRTVPDPLMQALDCPDASQLAPRRAAAATPLQALAMLNNRFLVRQSEHLAARLSRETEEPGAWIDRLVALVYGRPPGEEEKAECLTYAQTHGLANACRVVLNSNEFLFIP